MKIKRKGLYMKNYEEQNKVLIKEVRRLRRLCNEKDAYFTEMISDGMRHGSSLAGKHMADRKKYKMGR